MIDETAVENIKKSGVFKDSAQGRLDTLVRDIGFRMDQPAEYVVIGGCFRPRQCPTYSELLRISWSDFGWIILCSRKNIAAGGCP